MPRPPKLTPEQWKKARDRWESDPREGFEWLIKELKLPVTRPAIGQHARKSEPPWQKKTAGGGSAAPADSSAGKAAKVSQRAAPRMAPAKGLGESGKVSEGSEKAADDGRNFPSKASIHQTAKGSREPATVENAEGFVEPACMDDLEPNEQVFVREYIRDRNASAAAVRAGYSKNSAHALGPRILSRPRVQAAVTEYMQRMMSVRRMEAEDVLGFWSAILRADPGEIVQHRRDCCRHCWGVDFAYQYTPSEYDKALIRHEQQRADILGKGGNDIGDFKSVEGDWFNADAEPNPECPECFGRGVPMVYAADTRKLSPEARALLAGVKEGRDGIEIKLHDKPKITEFMARNLNLFNDAPDGGQANVVLTELALRYSTLMEKAREMQMKVLRERGLIIEADGD